jgi:hypothetical protein
MPQQTNLNVAPYFDDFDPVDDYHKVLFKPGYPVQARELTTLQSILQNQIERFGQHFFKEGAKVIPGNTGYTQLYYCIQLQNTYLGVPVAAYAEQLVGSRITGETSGVSAVVDKVLLPEDSERGNLTLYINYLNSSTANNSTQTFSDGENLTSNQIITSGLLGNSTIAAGAPFATTIPDEAAATGSAFQIQEGVYFIRGHFVNVNTETLILDQYGTNPNYRVGLFVNETIVNADEDDSLNDNSQGFNNYSAPGADRLKISVSLFKKPITDYNDDQFVELSIIEEGNIKSQTKRGDLGGGVGYKDWTDILARRTYAESGDYYVKAFDLSVHESLNDGIGNRGVYKSGQLTAGGKTPSDDLMLYKFSPGRAFIRGYDIDISSVTFIDIPKPRTTATIEDQSIIYNTGPTLRVNRTWRAPDVGVGNTYILSLRDQRVGLATDGTGGTPDPAGREIGVARVYDYRLESGSYSASNSSLNQWNLSLFDVQTTVDLVLNQATTLSVPTFVQGSRSGATAFIKDAVSDSNAVSLYEVEGDFIPNEALVFNGINDGRIATAVTAYSLSDVKSVFGSTDRLTGINTFAADVVQTPIIAVGVATITKASGGVSTVRSTSDALPGLFKVGNLVEYTNPSATIIDPTFGRVTSVDTDSIQIAAVTPVPGIVQGALPTRSVDVNDFKVVSTKLDPSSDNTLYTRLPKTDIESVDFTNASLTIRKVLSVDIANGQLSSNIIAGQNETFLPFDEERYALIRSDGETEALSADKLTIASGGTALNIFGLGANDTGSSLIVSLKKVKPTSKIKIKNRVKSIIVDKSNNQASGIGSTTLNDGLVYGGGNYPYGTRVQDATISLNVPDVIDVHGVFESADTNNATAPKVSLITINSTSTTTGELVVGESFIGETSGANGIVAEKLSSAQISYISKNDKKFVEGETVTFQETGITAVVSVLTSESFDISENYKFRTGQESTFYDQGRIIIKEGKSLPTKKLKIYYKSASFDSTDNGDLTTVESYKNFDYSKEIKGINGDANTDIIDIRPRVSEYTVAEDTRSPLEFFGRSFNGDGNSASNALASDEAILTTFSHYLGRIDRVFLDKNGKFQVIFGTPSELPQPPNPIDDALEVATITLPPYLYNVSQASLKFLEHKRYQMRDIKKLDNRISSLEYYTSLNLLEANTANLFVPDSEGLNRFKSGFFVDNFTGFAAQETSAPIKNSIDRAHKELRPRHYTNSIDLIFGPVVNADSTADLNFSTVEGNNIRKANDVITLDYSEVEYINQPFATRTESVTPFLISFWQGTMELNPASDTWVDTVRIEPKVIDVEGDYAAQVALLQQTENLDPQTGFAPIVWNAWETNWTGFEFNDTTTQRQTVQTATRGVGGWINGGSGSARWVQDTTLTTIEDTVRETIRTGVETRAGSQLFVHEQFDRESVGDRTVSRDLIPFMRSRNVEFISKRMKPLTRMHAFFDGEQVDEFCVPKLLEISMTSGTFQIGETVIGRMTTPGLAPVARRLVGEEPRITFRVAQANHREGEYNAPNQVFRESPYDGTSMSAVYSATSTILNVDTFSLSNEAQGQYSGVIAEGMILKGSTSGAEAVITGHRLVSDLAANLIGSFFIPNPNSVNHPRFETGTKVFTLTNDEDNDPDVATTIAEEAFTASGTLETVQENIISVRNARIERRQEFQERNVNENLGTQVVGSQVTGQTTRSDVVGWYDPLAQSFLVEEDTGVFVTKCDVYFRTKDDMDIPLVFQLRTMQNGFPTQKILPFSEIVVDPADIELSDDGSVATTIEFKAPVFLEGGQEYAIALASNSTKYSVYISRIGENDLLSDAFISNQPYLGSLFKSQNASTWEASQWEDLKFIMYRADFLESGTIDFYSPELSDGNRQIPVLQPDSLQVSSKTIRVGLGTTVQDSGYEIGNTFFQGASHINKTNATGVLIGVAGTIERTGLTISNAGIGLTPTDGSHTFTGVDLVTLSGNGRGAQATVGVNNGVVNSVVVTGSGGNGYQTGDVVGINTIGAGSVGRNVRLTVSGIGKTSELILDNVQGEFTVSGPQLNYFNSVGVAQTLNNDLPAAPGGDVQIASINEITDGLHIKVNHQNHGMYFPDNKVVISGVLPDIKPTRLSAVYSSDSTSGLSVENATAFSTFENVSVGTTNTGYLIIGEEVIEYSSVDGNTIGGNISRGNNPITYPAGTPVYKYELGGVNLHRINKTHTLSDVSIGSSITFDSYNIKLDMSEKFNASNDDRSDSTAGFPKLHMGTTGSTGGPNIKATQNMPFEIITPIVQNVTTRGTSISAEVRTTTGQSMSGNEIPYLDAGFESIVPNVPNYLNSTRLIASKVNEDAKLTAIEGAKSMQMRLNLVTTDSHISPVIDGQRVSTILSSNRVDSQITDIANDSRVKQILTDPTACQYISKEITLENPATSLKVILDAHINDFSDIRVLYAISNKDGFNPIFVPFPGYKNLNSRGQIIDVANSNGESDSFVSKTPTYGFESGSIEFKEHTFSIDELPSFKCYRIKILLTGTSQTYVPRARNLRVIALA